MKHNNLDQLHPQVSMMQCALELKTDSWTRKLQCSELNNSSVSSNDLRRRHKCHDASERFSGYISTTAKLTLRCDVRIAELFLSHPHPFTTERYSKSNPWDTVTSMFSTSQTLALGQEPIPSLPTITLQSYTLWVSQVIPGWKTVKSLQRRCKNVRFLNSLSYFIFRICIW
jgi:hypothetical protein